jgi:hypothetical protein
MNIGVTLRLLAITGLIFLLMLFAETKLDFIYAGF